MARKRVPEFSAFAIVPVVFGLQQLAEGFVWVGLERGWNEMVSAGSAVFLFFALAFWPIWFPIAAAIAEPSRVRRILIGAWMVVGLAWVWVYYVPLFGNDAAGLTACVCERSVQYWYSDSQLLAHNDWGAVVGYLLCTLCPLAMMSYWRKMIVPIALTIVSVVITILAFRHSFTSVWCFFAAIISLYTAWFLYHEANEREAITHLSDTARLWLTQANRSLS